MSEALDYRIFAAVLPGWQTLTDTEQERLVGRVQPAAFLGETAVRRIVHVDDEQPSTTPLAEEQEGFITQRQQTFLRAVYPENDILPSNINYTQASGLIDRLLLLYLARNKKLDMGKHVAQLTHNYLMGLERRVIAEQFNVTPNHVRLGQYGIARLLKRRYTEQELAQVVLQVLPTSAPETQQERADGPLSKRYIGFLVSVYGEAYTPLFGRLTLHQGKRIVDLLMEKYAAKKQERPEVSVRRLRSYLADEDQEELARNEQIKPGGLRISRYYMVQLLRRHYTKEELQAVLTKVVGEIDPSLLRPSTKR